MPMSPVCQQLAYVANELSRCIDNIHSLDEALNNQLVTDTIKLLSSQWHQYHDLVRLLAKMDDDLLSLYFVEPEHLYKEPTL